MRASTRWGSILCITMAWVALGTVQAAEPTPPNAPSSSRQAYNVCSKQAGDRKLDGQARLDFMAKCMQVKPPSGLVYH